MIQVRRLVVLLGSFFCVGAAKLPNYFKGCSLSDQNLSTCALSSGINGLSNVIKGDKKYQIPVLSPLHLDEVNLDVGDSLKMKFLNLTIYGMEDSILKDVTINPEERKWTIKIEIPLLVMIITYDIRGRILVLPIVGHGPGNFTLENVNFEYNFHYELEQRKNKDFIVLKDPKLSFVPSRVYFTLENLFNGEQRLGVEMNRFLNESWADVLKEIYPALAETISAVVTSVLNGYFSRVPYHEVLSQ